MEAKREGLSIRVKIILTIFIVTSFLISFIYFFSINSILKSYFVLENNHILLEIRQTENIFKNSISELNIKLADWASWDDTYSFISDKNEAYIESNLGDGSTISIQVNSMIFVNNEGNIVFDKILNLDTGQRISSEELISFIKSNISLFKFSDLKESFSGIIHLKDGDIVVVARPILKSNGEGPIAGTLIFGKFIDEKFISNIRNLAQLFVDVSQYDAPISEDFILAKENLSKDKKYFINLSSNDFFAGYFLLYDINDAPVSILRIKNTRDMYKQGINTFRFYMLFIIITLIIFSVIVFIFIEFVMTRRIYRLNGSIFDISRTKDPSKRVLVDSYDEIGNLSLSINNMLNGLYVAQEKEKNITEKEKNTAEKLKEQIFELDNSKKAIINLLEDIEIEKKQVEQVVRSRTKELGEEKSRMISSINSLSFGFIITSMDGRIILSNPVLLTILDIVKAPSDIEELSKLFKTFDFLSSYKGCVDTHETVEIKEVVFYNKFLRLFFAPVVNVNKIIDYVVIVEDITEAKISEISKDEFFAVASHELRTPLTAIRGNADMILDMYLDKIPNEDVKEMLVDINKASVRLINIVNDFLEVSKLEQGKIDIKMEEFELPEIIDRVVKDLQGIASKKNISLVYNIPAISLPKVLADKNHTEQVLINMINNAIKFTNAGSVIVNTEVKGDLMNISIIDTGIGIDPKNQSLLFRKFQQANDKILIRTDSNSTGLGLYISKLLLQNMGGDIRLEKSVPGSGSTFVFTLRIVM